MENSLSLTEENYIKAIFQIGTTPESNVSTNALADSLQTKPATVSDMIKKLSHKKLIFYEKYKGVTLSASGAKPTRVPRAPSNTLHAQPYRHLLLLW